MKLSHGPKAAPTQRFGTRLAIVAALAGAPACDVNLEVTPPPSFPATPSGYHTDRKDTRTVTKPDETHPESEEIARRPSTLEGKMDLDEIERMQSLHEEVYEQYVNPAFVQYLKQTGLSDKVYPSLDLLMRHPDDFDYIDKGNHRIEVVKRRPHNEARKHIPDKFLVVMEGANKEVTKVNDTDLKMPNGNIPWQSNPAYNKQMHLYRTRFNSEYSRHRDSGWHAKLRNLNTLAEPQRTREWRNMLLGPYANVSEPIKAHYELENIDFPKRFVDLVEARNFAFEINDPRFQDVRRHEQLQGETYDEITRQGYGPNGMLQVIVTPDPYNSGVYQIYTREMRAHPLRVNKKGFILTQQSDGRWAPDQHSHNGAKTKYFRDNPQVLALLQREAQPKITKINDVLNTQKLGTLRRVAKSISPEAWHISIENSRDLAQLRAGIRRIMNDDPAQVDKVAEMLNVKFDPTH